MSKTRPVNEVLAARRTLEGAGVRLRRAFGWDDARLDPFLLLDDFGSGDPEDYVAGFPWHPHRGIETITYLLEGRVAHGDSMGNKGVIGPGEAQWMTAGSGIIHEEMPQRSRVLKGYQLWANLPRKHKMTEPRYRDVHADDIPVVELSAGVEVRIICGEIEGVKGPVRDIFAGPSYLDVALAQNTRLVLPVPAEHNAFAYVMEGRGKFGASGSAAGDHHLVIFDRGREIQAEAGGEGARFLLISGEPLGEPVAWRGPIVMNTEEELDIAFEEYRRGTFIKNK